MLHTPPPLCTLNLRGGCVCLQPSMLWQELAYSLFMSVGWEYVSELRPPTGLLFTPQVIHEYRAWWNVTDRGKPKNSEKTYPSDSLPITDPVYTPLTRASAVRDRRLTAWAMALLIWWVTLEMRVKMHVGMYVKCPLLCNIYQNFSLSANFNGTSQYYISWTLISWLPSFCAHIRTAIAKIIGEFYQLLLLCLFARSAWN
jgi:hypothetical protein